MSTGITLDEKTGRQYVYVPFSSAQTSTFHANQIALDARAAMTEASSIVEDAIIRAYYDIVPKRTIDDFLRAHEGRMARRPRGKYVDIDLPMMDD